MSYPSEINYINDLPTEDQINQQNNINSQNMGYTSNTGYNPHNNIVNNDIQNQNNYPIKKEEKSKKTKTKISYTTNNTTQN